MRKRLIPGAVILLCALVLALCGAAHADEAENITGSCTVKLCSKNFKAAKITDGLYTSYWESDKTTHPWITVSSRNPIYGLYLCFQKMPEHYLVQREKSGGEWETLYEGDTRFHHMYYPIDGYKHLRVYVPDKGKTTMGFNEIFAFGEGDIPDWVQRWEPVPEKTEMLFLATHPDDEILFLGSAIAWYGIEKRRNITVAYLTKSNTTRRSEALNGLWELGIRTYPVFGEFRDVYANPNRVSQSYKETGGKDKVQGWVTELYRRLKPEVVVTQDLEGEYGHPQHKMVADAACAAFDLAADAGQYPDSLDQYGTWEVKKLYVHLYGKPGEQVEFDWTVPLESLGGQTPNERSADAYAMHKTQAGQGRKYSGVFIPFSVEEFGVKRYPNNIFGLYATRVGPDTGHDDMLENIEGIED